MTKPLTVTTKSEGFYVRESGATNYSDGTRYITVRSERNKEGKYRWIKDKSNASIMTYNAAQKCAKRYGGSIIHTIVVILETTKN